MTRSYVALFLSFLTFSGSSSAQPQQVEELKKIIALQQARINQLEELVSRTTKLEKLVYSVIDNEGKWVGNPGGLVGPQGSQGPQGSSGLRGPAGPAGRDGTTPCGKKIRIRTGIKDPRGDTWLSLGYGIATTDGRSTWPHITNYLECL